MSDVHGSKAAHYCLCKIMRIHWKFYLKINRLLFFIDCSPVFIFTNILLHFVVISFRSMYNMNASIGKQPSVTLALGIYTLKLTWIHRCALFHFYLRLPSYKLSIAIVLQIATHPYIRPIALFILYCIQVFHEHVKLDEKTCRNAFLTKISWQPLHW